MNEGYQLMMLMKNKVCLKNKHKIKRAEDGRIPDDKRNFLKNLGFIFNEREKVLKIFKVIYFQ